MSSMAEGRGVDWCIEAGQGRAGDGGRHGCSLMRGAVAPGGMEQAYAIGVFEGRVLLKGG